MGEASVYFVPDDQARWFNRDREVAESFWSRGIFLTTDDEFIDRRLAEYASKGRPLPQSRHNFMGFVSSPLEDPVPSGYLELFCPACNENISDIANEVWSDEEMTTATSARIVACPSCGAEHRGASLVSPDTEFTFARVYLWVSDVDPDDWEESFKDTVEEVLGPCKQYWAWES